MSSTPVLDRYLQLVAHGVAERDGAQEAVIAELDGLAGRIVTWEAGRRPGALGWLFGGGEAARSPDGLYIWGAVGRGKTMLMDLFFDATAIEAKRRVHFHAFMADVHSRIHAWRQEKRIGTPKGDDPIAPVAAALAQEGRLLCFDEFSVTDIADAMILGRLFQALFAAGVVIVATSNVEPDRLYEDGLNRALFLPFIALLQDHMHVMQLDARTDFRLEKLSGEPVYHVPADAAAAQALDAAFFRLTGQRHGAALAVDVLGRSLTVPEAAAGVARFSFAALCEQPLGPADYLAVARRFHTVLIDAIPVIRDEQRNEAKRFIMLIDTLYDRHVKLVASAAAQPAALYTASEGREAFEFRRTASRLIEMRSQQYLAMAHGKPDSRASGSTAGIAET